MVDLGMFLNERLGSLVEISGTDPLAGPWKHEAFVPSPLPTTSPVLSSETHLMVANARAAVGALDSTARQLPNPTLLRRTTLQVEAQSTSALEGTYEPLRAVLTADEDPPAGSNMREIQNYVAMANHAFSSVGVGRALTPTLLCELQEILVRGTRDEGPETGRVRTSQVVVGRRADAGPNEIPVKSARFVPSPPGVQLEADVQDLCQWFAVDRAGSIDPIVTAGMIHYQFETLHPFHDGNGRVGRLLIVLHMFLHGALSEPTLTVSPWFEERRAIYYEKLLHVSCTGDWDDYIKFFATGLRESADRTRQAMLALVDTQNEMKDVIRASPLRADTATSLVDYAVSNVSFTVRGAQRELGVSYGRANRLVQQLVELDLLEEISLPNNLARRFYSPKVLHVLTAD